jgi:hypothetical protein
MSYATLLTLGGSTLTNHGRTFEEKIDERSTIVELASGRLRKYVKYVGHEWTLSWTWLPNDTSTTDGNGGRDVIKALYDGEEKALVVYDLNGGTDTYTVFITDYNEKLLRRDYNGTRSYWEVSLTLKEA